MYLSTNYVDTHHLSTVYIIHRQVIIIDNHRIKSALGNVLWNTLAELPGDAQMVVPFYNNALDTITLAVCWKEL